LFWCLDEIINLFDFMDDWAVGIYVALLMLEPFADLVLVLPKDLFCATIVDLEL